MAAKVKKASQPPGYLSAATKAWWRMLTTTYRFEEAELRTIEVAALAYDRMTQARKVIAVEGITLTTTKGVVVHPATRVEHQAQSRYLAALKALNLGDGAPQPMRSR